MEEGNQILACDYSSQGYYFATAGKDRSVSLILNLFQLTSFAD